MNPIEFTLNMRPVSARLYCRKGCLQLTDRRHYYYPPRHYRQHRINAQCFPALERPAYDISNNFHHRHHNHLQRRPFSIDLLSSPVLLPPVVFLGLGITLWTYKCLMMILFQNKIIYMPSIPPFSRSETVETYAKRCLPVIWREEKIVTGDRVRIKLLIGSIQHEGQVACDAGLENSEDHLVVLYFQGNASSLPPRLPYLSDTIKLVNRSASAGDKSKGDTSPKKKTLSFVAVSYRGYWTSSGRASAKGIERDASAALHWVFQRYSNVHDLKIVLWGQSIGAGVATNLAAEYLESSSSDRTEQSSSSLSKRTIPIDGMVLETPFISVEEVLLAFYPQKWLPYRYLTPFLRSHWDSEEALRRIAYHAEGEHKPKILILQAGNDEVVPQGQAERIEKLCKSLGLDDVERKTIPGALHTDAMNKAHGRKEVARFLSEKL